MLMVHPSEPIRKVKRLKRTRREATSYMKTHPITNTVASLVKALTPRNRDILSRRFGLKKGKKETLESIGKSYGITRERVRQIEESTLAQLVKTSQGTTDLEKYAGMAKDIIARSGGIIKEKDLFREFGGSSEENVVNASLAFVLRLNKELVRVQENDRLHSFWALNKEHAGSFVETVNSVTHLLSKQKKILSQNDFHNFVKASDLPGVGNQTINDKHIQLCLNISKELDKNIFDEVGLVSWPEIKPSGVKDKAYLVLKREDSPKHFSEISKLINTAGFSGKKANVQTVHNELIKDNRFVLVGRGIYALSEWGYKPGTVKDVLVDILKKSSKPLSRTAILAKVMNNRIVKENTILLNLQDSRTFVKNNDGTYTLREA